MAQTQVTMEQFLRLSRRLDDFAQAVNSEVVLKVFPVGSLFFSLTEANPSGYLGGEWERYAKGCCIVGVDPDDPDFSKAGHKVGTKTVALTGEQNGAHTHAQNGHTHSIPALYGTAASAGEHIHGIGYKGDAASGSGKPRIAGIDAAMVANDVVVSAGAHTHSVTTSANISGPSTAVNQSSGSGAPHNNIQPSVPVYIWVRIA